MDFHTGNAEDRTIPARSEDRLLLEEANHRTANEVSAAIAAMRIARMAKSMNTRKRMIDDAIQRLEGFAEVHRLFACRPTPIVDASDEIDRLVRALTASRFEAEGSLITLELPTTNIDGPTARRLSLITAELVTNVVRHAFTGRRGHLKVSLSTSSGEVMLLVEDDGPGMRPGSSTGGTGLGSGIVADLIRHGGGRTECSTGLAGTRILVTLPLDAAIMREARRG